MLFLFTLNFRFLFLCLLAKTKNNDLFLHPLTRRWNNWSRTVTTPGYIMFTRTPSWSLSCCYMIVSKQQVPILHRIMLKSGQALTFDIRDTHTSNSICDVKVSVLSSGCGRSWYMSGQTKDYKIGICCFST